MLFITSSRLILKLRWTSSQNFKSQGFVSFRMLSYPYADEGHTNAPVQT